MKTIKVMRTVSEQYVIVDFVNKFVFINNLRYGYV